MFAFIHFQMHVKHFVCKCTRCLDPTEFGSYLGALRCRDCSASNECLLESGQSIGVLLPIDPTNPKSDLICNACKSTMPSARVS